MKRRNFLELTAASSTALLLSSLDTFASAHKPDFSMNTNFELKILATNWGFPGSLDEYCAKAKKEGYDGIELWWPLETEIQRLRLRVVTNPAAECYRLTMSGLKRGGDAGNRADTSMTRAVRWFDIYFEGQDRSNSGALR